MVKVSLFDKLNEIYWIIILLCYVPFCTDFIDVLHVDIRIL